MSVLRERAAAFCARFGLQSLGEAIDCRIILGRLPSQDGP